MSISLQAARRRIQRQPSQSIDDDKVLSFPEWCALNGFSPRTGRRIISEGGGPVVIQLSERRIGVRVGDNRRWQLSRARG